MGLIIIWSIKTMKKILLIFLIVPLLSMTNDNTSFIGKWLGKENNQIGYMIFDSAGFASFEANGQVVGGKEFDIKGETGMLTYKVFKEMNPIHVDLTLTKIESGEEMIMLCIAEFISSDSLKFAIGFDNTRPTEFNVENSLIFTRVKE